MDQRVVKQKIKALADVKPWTVASRAQAGAGGNLGAHFSYGPHRKLLVPGCARPPPDSTHLFSQGPKTTHEGCRARSGCDALQTMSVRSNAGEKHQ
eukprot:1185394-Prorocentrum_minimum.AAC.2